MTSAAAAARKRLQRQRECDGLRYVEVITDDEDEGGLIEAGMLVEAALDSPREKAAEAVGQAIKKLLRSLHHPVTRD